MGKLARPIFKCQSLTAAGYTAIHTLTGKRDFLLDRKRSVDTAMRKAIKQGKRAGTPEIDALIAECQRSFQSKKINQIVVSKYTI